MFAIRQALLVGFVLLLAACGGSSGGIVLPVGDSTTPPAPLAPLAKIAFPPMDALTTEGEILVRGTAQFAGGTIAEVQVNGVVADTTDGFATWHLNVRLQPGANTIAVGVIGSNGVSNPSADSVQVERQGPMIEDGQDIGLDANGDLIVLDRYQGVLRITLADEQREVVSNSTVGSGPAFDGIVSKMDIDRGANVAYVITNRSLYSVDLSNGARTEIVLTGKAPPSSIDALGINAAGGFAILAEDADLFRVDLASGITTLISSGTGYPRPEGILVFAGGAFVHSRRLIEYINFTSGALNEVSSSTVGSGPDLSAVNYDVAVDPTTLGRVLSLADDVILAVDVATGDRTVLSGDGVGQGPDFRGKALVSVPGGAYVVMDDGVMFVDLTSGDRQEVAPARVGSGPPLKTGDSEPDLAVDPITGSLLLADDGYSDLILIDPETGVRTFVPGTEEAEQVTCDPNGGVAYFTDDAIVFAIDMPTGVVRELSSDTVGSGPVFTGITDLTPGPQAGTLLVADSDLGAVLVDIATGDRSILTPKSAFPSFGNPSGTAADPGTEMVYVVEASDNSLFEIDGTTGAHTTLAGLSDFPNADDIRDAVFQTWDGNVYVCGDDTQIYRVTPGTGDVLTVSSGVDGSGPAINGTHRIDAAPESGILFVLDFEQKLIALDLATGTRVVVAR